MLRDIEFQISAEDEASLCVSFLSRRMNNTQ